MQNLQIALRFSEVDEINMKIKILIGLLLLIAFVSTAQKYNFVVAQDGTGQFRTVQEAFNAVPDFRKKPTTIYIKKGIYQEKLVLAESKAMVKIVGESLNETIIQYDDFAQKKNIFGEEKGTTGSSGFYVFGNEFSAQNITFQNTAGPVGQAVAVWVKGDKVQFRNCRFLGFQDTLYPRESKSRQYYKNCYIEGTTDFIFGPSTAVFQNCTIRAKSNSYITAASTTEGKNFGDVFLNCKIIADPTVTKLFLGRPWRAHAKTAFIRCELPKQIAAEGWNNWGNPANETTVRYVEYKSTGEGASAAKRVAWSKQLSDKEAKEYTLENIFSNCNATVQQESNWFQQIRTNAFEWPAAK